MKESAYTYSVKSHETSPLLLANNTTFKKGRQNISSLSERVDPVPRICFLGSSLLMAHVHIKGVSFFVDFFHQDTMCATILVSIRNWLMTFCMFMSDSRKTVAFLRWQTNIWFVPNRQMVAWIELWSSITVRRGFYVIEGLLCARSTEMSQSNMMDRCHSNCAFVWRLPLRKRRWQLTAAFPAHSNSTISDMHSSGEQQSTLIRSFQLIAMNPFCCWKL